MPDDSILLQKIGYFSIYKDRNGIHYIQTRNGVMCVPINAQSEVIFIEEYAPAVGERILSLPAGGIDQGESAESAANREMQEEIGYKATHLNLLGVLRPWTKYLAATIHIFVARELAPSKLEGDEAEIITMFHYPLDDFESLIQQGRLVDSTTIAALYMARSFMLEQSQNAP